MPGGGGGAAGTGGRKAGGNALGGGGAGAACGFSSSDIGEPTLSGTLGACANPYSISSAEPFFFLTTTPPTTAKSTRMAAIHTQIGTPVPDAAT